MGNYASIPEDVGVELYTLLDLGDTIDKAVNRKVNAYEIKFYLQDDNSTAKWIDLSDRVDSEGVNRLVSLASMTIKSEDKEDGSSFSTNTSGVTLDNHDGFFDDHIQSSLQEVGTGAAVDLNESVNWQENVFYRNQCKVVARFHLANGAMVDYTMGVFLVEKFETSYPFGKAEMSITGLAKPLMEQSADSVKGGNDWYRRVPVPFLIRALLENYYGQPLDSNWIISNTIELQTANNGSEKYISRYGRPPSLIGTGLGTSSEQISYNVSTDETRAICVWEWGTNVPGGYSESYVHTTANNQFLLTFNSISYVGTDGIQPSAGDVIEIYDSIWGNNGHYVINATAVVTTHLELYLKTALPGELGHQEKYHIHRVYMGVGEKLYYWIPKRDIYVLVNGGVSGKNIRRLWFNKEKGKVYGAAWTTPDIYGDIRVSLRAFKVDVSGITWQSGSIANVITGEICCVPGSSTIAQTGFVSEIGDRVGNGATIYGENICIPFKQQIGISTGNTNQTGWYLFSQLASSTKMLDSGVISAGEIAYKKEYEAGYYSIVSSRDLIGDISFNAHFSMGQVGCVLYNPYYGTDGTLFLVKKNTAQSVAPSYNYGTLDITTETLTWSGADPYIGGKILFPLCGCSIETISTGANKYYVYFAGIEFNTTPPSNDYYPSYILKVNLTDLTATTVWSDIEADKSTPLDMVCVPQWAYHSEALIVSGINKRSYLISNANDSIKYKVAPIISSSNWGSDCLQPHPFIKMIDERQRHTSSTLLRSRIVGIDPENGQLKAYSFSGNATTYTTTAFQSLDNYNTFTDIDFNCYSNLAIAYKRYYDDYGGTVNTNNIFSIVYGISSPYYDNDLMGSKVVGEYILWKFENSLSVSPPVADFGGMKIWEAISELAKSSMCVTNFDNQGNFFFINRSQETPYDRIYSTYDSDDNYHIVSIEKIRAFDEIYNICNFTPFKLVPAETEFSVTFPIRQRVKTNVTGLITLTEPSNTFPGESDFVVSNTDISRISIILHCVNSGILYSTAYGTAGIGGAYDKCRSKWKWLIETETIETFIASGDVNGQTTVDITLNDVSKITEDKLAIVTLSNQTEAVMTISNIDTTNNQIDWANVSGITGLTGSTGDSFPIGTIVKIVDATNLTDISDTPSYWSSDGVTYLTEVALGSLVGDGTLYITVNDVSRISIGTYLQLASVTQTSRYYLKVTQINSSNNRIWFEWGDEVSQAADNYLIDGGTGSFPAGTTPSTRTIVRAYWTPFNSSVASEIGNTGVSLSITLASIEDDWFKFESGDNIHISNEGMKLESASEQKVVISNATSIGKYGRKEYSMHDSKFMQKIVAQVLAQNVVAEYADPKYIFNVTTLLDPTLEITNSSGIINRVKIRSKEFFPRSPGYERKCKIRQIQHNFRNFTTQLTLKDVDAY